MENPLGLKSLNHISIVCRSLQKSVDFYQNVLGFCPVMRPRSFDFEGAWLFNMGMGVHLLQSEDPESMPPITHINPKHNHISFQSESMIEVEKRLEEMKMEYVKSGMEDAGISVDQLFFHDPDGTMIEVCNCHALPVVPIPRVTVQQLQPSSPRSSGSRLNLNPFFDKECCIMCFDDHNPLNSKI